MTAQETFAVEITRTFRMPVDPLYSAWTDAAVLRQWWGPTGFTCPVAETDVRAGGVSLVAMRAPAEFGAGDIHNTWTYTVVEPNQQLEFESRFATPDGVSITPAEAGIPGAVPEVVPHVLIFTRLDENQSQLSVTESGYPDAETRDMSRAGMDQCLDKLAAVLASPTP